MKESIKLVCFALFWVMWGVLICLILTKCGSSSPGGDRATEEEVKEVKRDTVFLRDTIVDVKPAPVNNVATEIRNRKMPVAKPDTLSAMKDFAEFTMRNGEYMIGDSVEVEIPITQAEYKSDDYHAWVSGYEPSLDSIRIFKQKEVVTVEKLVKTKNKHWHIGPTLGYGYTPKGFEPFIGVSLTYSIISF